VIKAIYTQFEHRNNLGLKRLLADVIQNAKAAECTLFDRFGEKDRTNVFMRLLK
jgi:hypothetical protein